MGGHSGLSRTRRCSSRIHIEVVVQVNGKLRDRLHVPGRDVVDELLRLALASERVQAHLDGAEPRKTIVVPDKLVSLVV